MDGTDSCRQSHPAPYQDAASAVSAEFDSLVSADFVAECDSQQLKILGALQEGNAMLAMATEFSSTSLQAVGGMFTHNTRLLRAMKTDLDHIFRKIRELKQRLKKQYPDAYTNAITEIEVDERPDLEAEK